MRGRIARTRKLLAGLFRPDPVRRLQARGLAVGSNFAMLQDVAIDWSHCWLVSIGDDVTLARGVIILAHDASTKVGLGYTRIAPVRIGDRVFIGAGSIILPGVTIGSDVVVGAGSVVTRDVPAGSIVAGNPARVISDQASWLSRKRAEFESVPVFGHEYTVAGGVTDEMKAEMLDRLGSGSGYIL